MRTRNMAGAFLTYEGRVLLLHRSMHKKIAPGMWSCVGGHLEPEELSDPEAACLREIGEETGIPQEAVKNLRLRYITVHDTGDEIRLVYYFMGELNAPVDLGETDEGELHWMDLADVAGLPMSYSVKQVVEHWLCGGGERVMLCSINSGDSAVTWVEL